MRENRRCRLSVTPVILAVVGCGWGWACGSGTSSPAPAGTGGRDGGGTGTGGGAGPGTGGQGSGGSIGGGGAGGSIAGTGGGSVAGTGGGSVAGTGGGSVAGTGGTAGAGAGTGGAGSGGTGAGGTAGTAGPAKPIDRDTSYANATEVLRLSGTGIDDAVNWSFTVTGGRRSGQAATIPVPSNWEFHGFGTFHYGTEARTTEQGIYDRSFDVPAGWTGKRIFLVFEGSMTDTAVMVNGQSAGPVHQGAFYRFRYDITNLVQVGSSNRIQVTVAKESADTSVNEAERQADYWAFGGIFRPVYLEAYPSSSIDRVAVNARADGALTVQVFLRNIMGSAQLTARVLDENLTAVGSPLTGSVTAGQAQVTLLGSFAGVRPWSAETPHRYRLAVELETTGGGRHAVRENFGFRTLEVRPGNGIYVNGTKVMLKGVNRHCFWPESGRALSPRLSLADVTLLKGMNVNAVRNSHYPADRHFLDYADALGLSVLDELAGWQSPPYAEAVGRRLIEEMVTFNVNHPSIIFWDNGNEGGWNTALDADFARWDPQQRPVLHPWATFSNINTDHYESYASTVNILSGNTIFLPTEFLHGLYDGGGGAGLEDYWTAMRQSPRGAGGFLWAWVDEGVLRADLNGQIDVKGNAAPDGIVGPYRQKEGSYDSIRQLWSPVRIAMDRLLANFSGAVAVENDYDFLNLDTVTFAWRLAQFDVRDADGGHTVMAQGTARTGSIAPGASGTLQLDLPAGWRTAHALLLDATDSAGTLIGRWSWMISSATQMRQSIVTTAGAATATAMDGGSTLTVSASGASFTFNKASGQLAAVTANGQTFSLRNGPAPSVGTATLQSFSDAQDGNDHVVTATYTGALQQVLWRVTGNGWLALTYRYSLSGSYDHHGVSFDYPEAQVRGVEWLGRGPYRVWKNRMKGPWHDLWQRDKNDAITGQNWMYPEFKGYFADVHWARLKTSEGDILFVVDSPDIFLRLFTPQNGVAPQTATAIFPAAQGISFMHGISGIGDKFLAASATGPQGQQHTLNGAFEGTVYLRFGDPLP
jgi:beta-galactosidase/beta-glucuronidase